MLFSLTLVAASDLGRAVLGHGWRRRGSKLIRKVLYVGAFALHHRQLQFPCQDSLQLLRRVGPFSVSFALSHTEFLQPGRLAWLGIEASRPLLDQISSLGGFPEVFSNLDSILVLFLAWLVVIISFLFPVDSAVRHADRIQADHLRHFSVPFALWNKTAFLAEKVLGNVLASGIKVLVLAVIVGIGTGFFAEFRAVPEEPSLDHALVVMLASLALLGLGILRPGIATGLVSGAPQLGAGAAAGTALGAAGMAAGAAAVATGVGGAVLAGSADGARSGAFPTGWGQAFGGGHGASSRAPTGAPYHRCQHICIRRPTTPVGQTPSAQTTTHPRGNHSRAHATRW